MAWDSGQPGPVLGPPRIGGAVATRCSRTGATGTVLPGTLGLGALGLLRLAHQGWECSGAGGALLGRLGQSRAGVGRPAATVWGLGLRQGEAKAEGVGEGVGEGEREGQGLRQKGQVQGLTSPNGGSHAAHCHRLVLLRVLPQNSPFLSFIE